ncbi:MAG: hypothetical protein LBR65_04255 [Culturomica sp.]|jgi:hypothetical protein|nr:hypothetical protein [Culturomica sp.]
MSTKSKKKPGAENPLEQLRERKRELHYLCLQEECRLKDAWEYARCHSGSLLLSGVAGWFFSKQKNTAEEASCSSGGIWSGIWSVIRPFLGC